MSANDPHDVMKSPKLPEEAAMALWSLQIVTYLTEDGSQKFKPYVSGDVTLGDLIQKLEMVKLQLWDTHSGEIGGAKGV